MDVNGLIKHIMTQLRIEESKCDSLRDRISYLETKCSIMQKLLEDVRTMLDNALKTGE